MSVILWALLQNFLVVVALTPCVWLLVRCFAHRPALQHWFWLVLLIKFILPPVVQWPGASSWAWIAARLPFAVPGAAGSEAQITATLDPHGAASTAQGLQNPSAEFRDWDERSPGRGDLLGNGSLLSGLADGAALGAVDRIALPSADTPPRATHPHRTPPGYQSALAAASREPATLSGAWGEGWGENVQSEQLHVAAVLSANRAPAATAERVASAEATAEARGDAPVSSLPPSPTFGATMLANGRHYWEVWRAPVLMTCGIGWLLGALLHAARHWRQIRRHERLLSHTQAAPASLRELVDDLARQLQLPNVRVELADGISSPFVWCAGGVRLLWPSRLSSPQQLRRCRGVIAHELAHLSRRDHWVAWLEMVASVVWWWNPWFWWVRRGLRESAELACDAVALRLLPEERRRYAEVFLELSVSSKSRTPVPVLGVSTGAHPSFKRRLSMMLSDRVTCKRSRAGAVLAGALALAALPGWSGSPRSSALQADETEPSATQPAEVDAADDEALAVETYVELVLAEDDSDDDLEGESPQLKEPKKPKEPKRAKELKEAKRAKDKELSEAQRAKNQYRAKIRAGESEFELADDGGDEGVIITAESDDEASINERLTRLERTLDRVLQRLDQLTGDVDPDDGRTRIQVRREKIARGREAEGRAERRSADADAAGEDELAGEIEAEFRIRADGEAEFQEVRRKIDQLQRQAMRQAQEAMAAAVRAEKAARRSAEQAAKRAEEAAAAARQNEMDRQKNAEKQEADHVNEDALKKAQRDKMEADQHARLAEQAARAVALKQQQLVELRERLQTEVERQVEIQMHQLEVAKKQLADQGSQVIFQAKEQAARLQDQLAHEMDRLQPELQRAMEELMKLEIDVEVEAERAAAEEGKAPSPPPEPSAEAKPLPPHDPSASVPPPGVRAEGTDPAAAPPAPAAPLVGY